MPKVQNTQEVMNQLSDFFRTFLPKESTADTPAQMSETDPVTDSQGSLGKDQTSMAEETGSKAGGTDVVEDRKEPVHEMGTRTMMIDEKATEVSAALPTPKQLTSGDVEQKEARLNTLHNAILSLINQDLEREEQLQKQAEAQQKSLANMTPEDRLLQKMAERSMEFAQQAYEIHLMTQIQRHNDKLALQQLEKEGKLDKGLVQKYGGLDGLLDKLAEDDPGMVLGDIVPEDVSAAAPVEAAAVDAAAAESGDTLTPEEEALAQEIAQQAAEAGLTEDQLEAGSQLIEDLRGQGYSDDQIVEAIQELVSEEVGGAEAAPAEAGTLPPEAEQAAADVVDAAAEAPTVTSAESTPSEESAETPPAEEKDMEEKTAEAEPSLGQLKQRMVAKLQKLQGKAGK